MCKIGDIIVVDSYKDHNKILRRHSFIVIDDKDGIVEGLPYHLICNVLSSFKNEEQKKRKLSYPGNFPVANEDTVTNPDNGLDGFVKTDQLYYFSKDKISYQVIGNVVPEILELIFDYIEESDFDIITITDNL